MSTWKQELAEAITPIEGLNNVSAELTWNIRIAVDPYSPLPQTEVKITRTLAVKAPVSVDVRLVDGKNYLSGDSITEVAFLTYYNSREPLPDDPEIISGGVKKTLNDMRPMSRTFGLELGTDSLTIAGDTWYICRADADGWLDDEETGESAPAKLRLTLRK